MALASSRVNFSRLPVKTTVLPATGLSVATASGGSGVTCWSKLCDDFAIVRLAEEVDDGFGDDRADAFDAG